MSYARPKHENDFVRKRLEKEIRALSLSPDMLRAFVDFAAEEGKSTPEKLRPRMYHVLNGRCPSAYIALLMHEFFHAGRYKGVVCKTIDYVEYVTSDGVTGDLESFVRQHPMQLRIVKVKMLKSIVKNGVEPVAVLLRTPIAQVESSRMTSAQELRAINARAREFRAWLKEQEPLPHSLALASGEVVNVEYDADWLESIRADEDGFESRSDLSASVDIMDGVHLILCCGLKERAPCIRHQSLDAFYVLHEFLGHDWSKVSAIDFGTRDIVNAIEDDASALPYAFYHSRHHFPAGLARQLDARFARFGRKYTKLVAKSAKYYDEFDRNSCEPPPSVRDFRQYEEVRKEFVQAIKPFVVAKKNEIVASLLRIMRVENVKAQKHLSRLQDSFLQTG